MDDPVTPQNPELTSALRNMFGDTAADALKDLRCVREPMGCGKPISTICCHPSSDDGPCVLVPDHDGNHLHVRQAAETPEAIAADRRIVAAFRSDASVREWMLVGLCQSCQDKLEASARRDAEY